MALLLAGGQQAALAGGGPGTGTPYGGVTCWQSYAPQCDVTVGTGPSAGTPASPGTQAGSQPAAGAAGGGAAGGCQGTENKTFGCVPAGCQVTVQTLACPIGAAAPAARLPGGGPAPPDPAVLAALARQTLGLPSPVIRSSPRPGGVAAHQPANLAVDQPRGMGAGVQYGHGAGGERDRDRHPGVGDLASRRQVDGDLPGGGHSVHERG